MRTGCIGGTRSGADPQREAALKKTTTSSPNEYPFVFRWNRPGLAGRKGQRCKVLARGKMNSCAIEFEDGFRAVVSRNALRRWHGEDQATQQTQR